MLGEIIEYDNRIGVPEFQGWKEREKENEINFHCKCTWPACNHLTNCRNK